jgi:hypothetical protein
MSLGIGFMVRKVRVEKFDFVNGNPATSRGNNLRGQVGLNVIDKGFR